MAVEWRVRATEFANCNCIYACPCQFNALPTNGNCHAAGAWQVEEGQFGAVRLDGLRVVGLYNFPGPVWGMSRTIAETSTTLLSPFSTPSLKSSK